MSTAHTYDRQMEGIPPEWIRCDWECYFSFYKQYVDEHIWASAAAGKPFVIEEFNVIAP